MKKLALPVILLSIFLIYNLDAQGNESLEKISPEKDGAGFGYSWGILLKDTPLAKLIGGTGYFFSGLGVHSLAIIPELKYVLVVRLDTDRDFTFPDRAGNLKMYQIITASRIKE